MALFDLEEVTQKIEEKQQAPKIKLKKGQTINDLIEQARQIVNEKLGKYKDTSRCVTDINDLYKFFNDTKELVALDTETTRSVAAILII